MRWERWSVGVEICEMGFEEFAIGNKQLLDLQSTINNPTI